ncbi:MAG: argininosuccinate lyase [Oscillospiraceae bacterium]|jgi:argininosuccinate lyase|nr:argininosuccinate lyase [Oscillospiraceae bacterium]
MRNENRASAKLWGGGFDRETDAWMDDFHASIRFDRRLYRQDIQGSIAHATMLGEQGIISAADARAIVDGLRGILSDADAGRIAWRVDAEDIHMNIEALLTERIGEAGKRLHTGRSRNDQIALDTRMYVKDACGSSISRLKTLAETMLSIARRHTESIMPGYTHLQRAQPVTLAHHMMAYVEMVLRDMERFARARDAADVSPLGSGALAGTTYPLDRARVAELLGFSRISANSLDAVSDRDYVLDTMYACSVCMMHLSRLCEELALWSSLEFRFITISDAYATGSSMMPQKKNPDAAELIRGKTGRVYGGLLSLLVTMKGLPLAYNKDMQEDKEPLFDALDTLDNCARILERMLATAAFHTQRMARRASDGFTNATDAADYLAGKGMPFREAHEVVGGIVRACASRECGITDLTLDELREFSQLFDEDAYEALSMKSCVARRNLPGGPAAESVEAAMLEAVKRLAEFC